MNELQQLRDEIAQLQTALTVYRSTLRNVLKDIRDDIARGGLAPSWGGVAETISIVINNVHEEIRQHANVEIESQQTQEQADTQQEPVAWVNPSNLIQDGYSHTFAAYSEQYAGFTPLYAKPSVLKDRNVTYSTSTQQAPAQQVPEGMQLVPVDPSPAILEAIDLLCDDSRAFDDSHAFWSFLLAAAPQAEQPGG